MESITKKLFLTAIFLVLIFSNHSYSQAQDQSYNIINLNDGKYQEITFDDIIEKYSGKLLYIDFWASWCKPCLKEIPYIIKIQEEFADKELSIIFISPDRNADAWKAKIEELEIKGDHYLMNPGIWKEVKQKLDLSSIPKYVLISHRGKIIEKDAEKPSDPDLIKKLNSKL